MTTLSHDGATEAQLEAALARCATGERAALKVIYDIEAARLKCGRCRAANAGRFRSAG
jgi:hypothetical protein